MSIFLILLKNGYPANNSSPPKPERAILTPFSLVTFETKKVLFSELDETMQKAVLTQKEYANDEVVELNDYDQNKYWKFVSSCLQLSEGINEDEADEKIESINELYKFGAEFQNQIIKLQTLVSPNEIATN